MRLISHPLPSAVFDPSHAESARLMMIAARERLEDLESQLNVLKLAGVFELSPFLEGFAFRLVSHYTDEGDAISACEHEFKLLEGAEPSDEQLLELDHDIEAFLSHQPEEWIHERSGSTLCRPSDEALIPGLMRQILPPEAFARWQAGCLESDLAPTAQSPAPTKAL